MKLYYLFYLIAFIFAYTAHSIMKEPWSPKVKWASLACIIIAAIMFSIGLGQVVISLGHIKINIEVM